MKTDELRIGGAEVVIGSVADKGIVDKFTQGVDVVHYLAAAFRELDVPNSYYDEINVGGSGNVLEAAEKYNLSTVIYCSTCGVHGNVAPRLMKMCLLMQQIIISKQSMQLSQLLKSSLKKE